MRTHATPHIRMPRLIASRSIPYPRFSSRQHSESLVQNLRRAPARCESCSIHAQLWRLALSKRRSGEWTCSFHLSLVCLSLALLDFGPVRRYLGQSRSRSSKCAFSMIRIVRFKSHVIQARQRAYRPNSTFQIVREELYCRHRQWSP